MIKIAVIGDIGSGKSYIARLFGYPVFNADDEVAKLYRESKKCFNKLKKVLPKYIDTFPVNKNSLSQAIIENNYNLKKIVGIIHPEIRIKMKQFIKKNKNKKFIILDIPLLIENRINKKKDVIIEKPIISLKKSLSKKYFIDKLNKILSHDKKIYYN